MSKFTASDVLELPVSERLQLVEDIWSTIADAPDALELTEEDNQTSKGLQRIRCATPSSIATCGAR